MAEAAREGLDSRLRGNDEKGRGNDKQERGAEIADKKRVENARAWLRWFIESEDQEYTAMARRLGLSESGGRNLVSRFANNKLDVDPTQIVLAVESLRAQVEGPEGITKFIGFRETRSAKMLWRHVAAARDGHFVGVVVGPVGFGKTEAVREFQRRVRNDGKAPVEYVYARVTTNLPALINEVAETIGLIDRGRGGDPARLHRLIAQSLRSRPRFFVFDEGDYLNDRCLTFVRNLHDESGAGMAIVGRPMLLKTIDEGLYWSRANGDGKDRVVADGPLAPFVDRIFSAVLPGLGDDEVVEVAEDVLKGKLTEDAVKKLLFYVGPNFRLLSRVIGALRDIRIKGGRTIDHQMIEAAWRKLQRLESRK